MTTTPHINDARLLAEVLTLSGMVPLPDVAARAGLSVNAASDSAERLALSGYVRLSRPLCADRPTFVHVAPAEEN